MSQSSKIPSPSRSQGAPVRPRQQRTRRTLSVPSPARSDASGRLIAVVEQYLKADKFTVSPMRSVLPDDTDIEMPRRASWWKRLEGSSRDIFEALDTNQTQGDYDEYEFVAPQEKQTVQTLQENSDSGSVASIVVAEIAGSKSLGRTLLDDQDQTIKVLPKKLFSGGQPRNPVVYPAALLDSTNKSLGRTLLDDQDQTIKVLPKKLFSGGQPRNPVVYPAALLDSTNKTINKTVEPEPNKQRRNLFGKAGTKRKNMFTDLVLSDSEDDSLVQHKVFGFKRDNKRISLASRNSRMPSLTPSVTADIDIDDWNLLPSSTMIGNGSGAMEESRITANEETEQAQADDQDVTLTEPNESLEPEAGRLNTSNRSRKSKSINTTRLSKSKKLDDDFDKTLTNENIEEQLNEDNHIVRSLEQESEKEISHNQNDDIEEPESSKDQEEDTNKPDFSKEITNDDQDDAKKAESDKEISNDNQDEEMEPIVWSDNDAEKASISKDNDAQDKEEKVENYDKEEDNEGDDNKQEISDRATPFKEIPNKSQKIVESSADEDDGEDQEQKGQENDIVDETPNSSYATTGRNRKKHETEVKSPEIVLKNTSKDDMSFKPIGRSTSFRKSKSAIEDSNVRPTMIPIQESTIGSEGSRNSSTEGSGWDSHRTTRQTLRQTFGKDFTPRKSLRALVMEQTAKRQMGDITTSKANKTKNKTVEDVADHNIRYRRVSNRNLSTDQLADPKSPVPGISTHHETDPLISKPRVSYHKSLHDINEPHISHQTISNEKSVNNFQATIDSGPEISIDASYGQGISREAFEHENDHTVDKTKHPENFVDIAIKKDTVPVETDQVMQEELDYEASIHDASAGKMSELEKSEALSEKENTEQHENSIEELSEHDESEALSEKENTEQHENSIEELPEHDEEDEREDSEQEVEAEESEQDIENEDSQPDSEEEMEHEESQQIEDESEQHEDHEMSQKEIELESEEEDRQESKALSDTENFDEHENSIHELSEHEEDEGEDSEQEVEEEQEIENEESQLNVESESEQDEDHQMSQQEIELESEEEDQQESQQNVSQKSDANSHHESEQENDSDVSDVPQIELESDNEQDDQTSEKLTERIVFDNETSDQEIDYELSDRISRQITEDEVTEQGSGMEGDREISVSRVSEQVKDLDESIDTRRSLLLMQMKKVAQKNMERRKKVMEQIANSLKRTSNTNVFMPMQSNFPARRITKPAPKKRKNPPRKTTQAAIALPKEFLEDLKYKPPKRYAPTSASWITKRLYNFLETKLEPRYDYRARVRAEDLVKTIHSFTKLVRRHHLAPQTAVDELKKEMARLNIVKTHFDFYEFFFDFMPREVRVKVNPDLANGLPMPRNGIFGDILHSRTDAP